MIAYHAAPLEYAAQCARQCRALGARLNPLARPGPLRYAIFGHNAPLYQIPTYIHLANARCNCRAKRLAD